MCDVDQKDGGEMRTRAFGGLVLSAILLLTMSCGGSSNSGQPGPGDRAAHTAVLALIGAQRMAITQVNSESHGSDVPALCKRLLSTELDPIRKEAAKIHDGPLRKATDAVVDDTRVMYTTCSEINTDDPSTIDPYRAANVKWGHDVAESQRVRQEEFGDQARVDLG
jgi:hypothetical protein